jgi:hypothetical protein
MHTRRTVVAVVALCALFVSLWMLPDSAASEGAREPSKAVGPPVWASTSEPVSSLDNIPENP